MYHLIDAEDEKELENITRWSECDYRGHGMSGWLATTHVKWLLERLDMMKLRYEKHLNEAIKER